MTDSTKPNDFCSGLPQSKSLLISAFQDRLKFCPALTTLSLKDRVYVLAVANKVLFKRVAKAT